MMVPRTLPVVIGIGEGGDCVAAPTLTSAPPPVAMQFLRRQSPRWLSHPPTYTPPSHVQQLQLAQLLLLSCNVTLLLVVLAQGPLLCLQELQRCRRL